MVFSHSLKITPQLLQDFNDLILESFVILPSFHSETVSISKDSVSLLLQTGQWESKAG